MRMSSQWAKLTAVSTLHIPIQRASDSKLTAYCMKRESKKKKKSSSIHVQPFRSISIKLDVQEGGLKWTWLFQMKTFSPWNWLLLKLAGCSVALLSWEQFRGLKWAGGDVKIMPVSDLDCSPCQVSASLTFLLNEMCGLPEVTHVVISFTFFSLHIPFFFFFFWWYAIAGNEDRRSFTLLSVCGSCRIQRWYNFPWWSVVCFWFNWFICICDALCCCWRPFLFFPSLWYTKNTQTHTYETTSDPGAFIFNETPSPGGFGVIVRRSWLGAAEPYADKVGGARAFHLPALTAPRF